MIHAEVKKVWILASAMVLLVGMFFGRLVMLLSAQVKPIGVLTENRPEFVSYFPSMYEIGIIILAFTLSMPISSIGGKFWNLEAIPE